MKKIMISLVMFTALASPSLAASPIEGKWRIDNGNVTIRIAPCGAKLCGTIVALKKPLDKHGNPKRDKENPDPAKRDRPMMGLTTLYDMEKTDDNEWTGQVYNATDGHTYTSYLKLDGREIRVQGCVGPICKSRVFERVD